jgi:aminopeptidase N
MDRWHGKHPIPWDFFNTFNNVSGRNLNWFWNNWYFSNNYIDMAVSGVSRADRGYSLTIDNIGGMAAPVDVRVKYSDGDTATFHQTPAIWESNQKQATVRIPTEKTISSLDLDGGIWMDANTTNNGWTASGR